MTVLVTGASGFIGGRLVQRLRGEGVAVRAFVRASSDVARLEQLGVKLSIGDLADGDSLDRAAEGCQHVFHCGALVSDWATIAEIQRVNIDGTGNAARAAARAGAERFVHLSTTDIYGYPRGVAVTETQTPGRFANWYAETKLAAEREVRRVERATGLPAVILRPATVYGPGSADVVGDIARAIRAGHMLLVGRGRAVAGLVYVENLIDAALLAVREAAAAGQAFNVTDGLAVTWREFTSDLAAALDAGEVRYSLPYGMAIALGTALELGYRGVRKLTGITMDPLLSRQAVQVLGRNQDFSNRRLRETLGWSPRVEYRAGLAATVAWLREDYLGR